MTPTELQRYIIKHLRLPNGKRKALLAIFIGTNGTGKTTLMKLLLDANERNLIIPSGRDDIAWRGIPELTYQGALVDDTMRPGKKMHTVLVPEIEEFTGNRLLHVDGDPRIFNAVSDRRTGFRNGGLFMDDFRNYVFTKGTLRQEVDGLFINRRHRMLDICMACHGFEDVSRDLLRFEPILFIFRTTLPPTDASVEKMANADQFLATIDEVNYRAANGEPYYFEPFKPAL